jgi:riboflavin synthase alpha subunit
MEIMFTGIIQEIGTVASAVRRSGGVRLTIRATVSAAEISG